MKYDGPEISRLYWSNTDWDVFRNGRTNFNSTRIAVLDEMGRFLSSDRMSLQASDMGCGVKRRLTMDHDGNLRLCIYAPEPKCSVLQAMKSVTPVTGAEFAGPSSTEAVPKNRRLNLWSFPIPIVRLYVYGNRIFSFIRFV